MKVIGCWGAFEAIENLESIPCAVAVALESDTDREANQLVALNAFAVPRA